MPVRGDFDRLRALIHGTELLSSQAWRAELYRSLAEEGQSLVVDAFETSRDPYGAGWAPSRQRRRGARGSTRRGRGQILRDTDRLFSSIHSRASSNGFEISTNVPYARIHNFGGVVERSARTELRAYKITGRDKRTRVPLSSKARRKAVSAVSARASSFRVPRRMFIPPADNIGPRWRAAFESVIREAAEGVFS